jgi:hypothetical protein
MQEVSDQLTCNLHNELCTNLMEGAWESLTQMEGHH